MNYQEKLIAGIEAAEKAGDMQGARRLATELAKSRTQTPAQPPSMGENIGAGAIEGAAGMVDLASTAGTWAGKKLGIVDEDTQAPQLGESVSGMLGMEPDRDSFAYRAANIAGGGLTGGPVGAIRSGGRMGLKSAAKGLVANSAAGVAGAGAGMAAEGVGEAIGGDTGATIGRMAGETLGSIMAPAAMVKGKQAALNHVLAGDDTLEHIAQADRLNVPLSVGLVGNKNAQYYENFTGIAPLMGQNTLRKQQAQFDAMGEARTGAAERTLDAGRTSAPMGKEWEIQRLDEDRMPMGDPQTFVNEHFDGDFGYPSGSSIEDIGAQVRAIADSGQSRLRGDMEAGENGVMWAVGPDKDVSIRDTFGVLSPSGPLYRGAAPPQQKTLDYERRVLDKMTNQTDEARRLAGAVAAASGTPDEIQALRDFHAYMSQRNVRYDQLDHQRKNVGRNTNLPSMDGGQQDTIYGSLRQDQHRAAIDAGVGDTFAELKDMEKEMYRKKGSLDNSYEDVGRLDKADKLISMEDDKAVYNWINQGKDKAVERFSYLAKMAGGPGTPRYRQFMSDYFTNMGKPLAGSTLPQESFDPVRFITNWRGLDSRIKNLIHNGDPELRSKLDDMAGVSTAMKERGKASNPSGTTIMALPAAALSQANHNPAKAAGALVTALLMQRGLLSEDVARSLGSKRTMTGTEMRRFKGRGAAILDSALQED